MELGFTNIKDKKDFRPWSDLPDALLSLIADRVTERNTYDKNQVFFGAVCQSWHSVYKEIKQRPRKLPHLMIPTSNTTQNCSIYSLSDKKFIDLQVSIPHNTYCPGSNHGWLVKVADDYKVSLLNLLPPNNEIHLPSLSTLTVPPQPGNPKGRFYLHKAILSDNPMSRNPNFVVMGIFQSIERLWFFTPGEEAWKLLDMNVNYIQDVIYSEYHRKFYAVNHIGEVFEIDFKQSLCDPYFRKIRTSYHYTEGITKRYIVESVCNGEIWQILKHDRVENGFEFFVFKLDIDRQCWIKMNDLQGCAVFLGKSMSFSLLAADYLGCQPNTIYFADDTCGRNNASLEVGVFSFDDSTASASQCLMSSELNVLPAPIWMDNAIL